MEKTHTLGRSLLNVVSLYIFYKMVKQFLEAKAIQTKQQNSDLNTREYRLELPQMFTLDCKQNNRKVEFKPIDDTR